MASRDSGDLAGRARGSSDAPDDALDFLWTSFLGESVEGPTERILFTSASPGEGTTTMAACSALGMARNLRESVLLVEANLREPGLARMLGLPPTPGFSELLDGTAAPTDCLHTLDDVALDVLVAGGGRMPMPGELRSPTARMVLEDMARAYRYVVIDAPPVLTAPETRLLLAVASSAVLVVRARSTPRDQVLKAQQAIERAGVRLQGAVLNRYRSEVPGWLARRGVG